MTLPELSQRTSATVILAPEWNRDGRPVVVVVIKQRFSIGPHGQVARMPGAEVAYTDVPWDADEESSSARLPSDLCLRKPATDVLVAGEAVAPDGQPVRELDVLVRVGPVERALRVFGTRLYYRGGFGLTLTEPLPFERVPLRWELAYGGTDADDPKQFVTDRRNPVGRGVAAKVDKLDHKLAPQVEDPRDLISGAKSRPRPAGVAPLGPHFEPRAGWTGTMDGEWQAKRMPLRPLDFDERHNQVAPPDLICPGFLRGGESFQLLNLSPQGVLHGHLPRVAFSVWEIRDRGRHEHRPVLDTVVFEPGGPHVDLTWRAAMLRGGRPDVLRSVLVYEKELV